MSLFNELKRRNVIRVAIAYGVASWFLLQLADLVLENITAPDWVMQAIMLVFALGFPLVVIFAWAFEMTPEGLKREHEVDRSQSVTHKTGRKLDRMIIGVLVLGIGYLLADKFLFEEAKKGSALFSQQSTGQPENTGEEITLTPSVTTPANTGPSIAVLPFVNMSGDKENEYFSDGLTETLLHMLSQLPNLHVAARTSSFAFKGKNESITTIAQALGVDHILEGSVQKSGNRVRITAQLIRADDGFHVWSQNYDRTLVDIFAIQDEIAGDVAEALGTSLLGMEAASLHAVETTNLNAYDSYLKGLQQQAIFSYSSLAVAENHFKQALARDPSFTDARLALVRNYILKNSTGLLTDDELATKVGPLLSQVGEQQPNNPLARAFAIITEFQSDDLSRSKDEFQAGIDELRHLLSLLPTETFIRRAVARPLNFFFKQPQQAIEVIQAGLLVDPLAAGLHSTLGNIYRDQEQLDLARDALQRAQQLAPENPNYYSYLSDLEKDSNNLLAALDWSRKATEVDPQDHELAALMAGTFYQLELPEEGDRWYARVKALVPDSPTQHRMEIERAVARKEFALAISMAKKVISAQPENRRGAFGYPLLTYSRLMLDNGKAREAYDFLVSVRPEIADYANMPTDFRGALMQYSSVILMTGFENFETRKQAWQQLTANWDAKGFPWRDPRNNNLMDDYIIRGDNQAAIDNYLNIRLNMPMARNLGRHKRLNKTFYAPLYDDPAVAARLSQLDGKFSQLREQVAELMQEPEWNQ